MPLDTISTSARAELAAINEALAAATADRDEAQRAVDRLQLPVVELDKAIAELTAVRAAYDARITAWYADGCPGMRPSEPADLAALEHSVSQLTRDGGASRPALGAARDALAEANGRLGSLAAQRPSTEALWRPRESICAAVVYRRWLSR